MIARTNVTIVKTARKDANNLSKITLKPIKKCKRGGSSLTKITLRRLNACKIVNKIGNNAMNSSEMNISKGKILKNNRHKKARALHKAKVLNNHHRRLTTQDLITQILLKTKHLLTLLKAMGPKPIAFLMHI
jgi:hypothetical protein